MRRWTLLLFALLLLITACGGSPDEEDQNAPTERPTDAEPTEPQPTLEPRTQLALGVIAAPNVVCDAAEEPDTCTVEVGSQFTLTAAVSILPPDGFSGFQLEVVHAGLTFGEVRYVIPDFQTFSRIRTESFLAGGVTALSPPIPLSTYLGPIIEADLNCPESPATLEISLPVPTTDMLDDVAMSIPIAAVQRDADRVADVITIECVTELS